MSVLGFSLDTAQVHQVGQMGVGTSKATRWPDLRERDMLPAPCCHDLVGVQTDCVLSVPPSSNLSFVTEP